MVVKEIRYAVTTLLGQAAKAFSGEAPDFDKLQEASRALARALDATRGETTRERIGDAIIALDLAAEAAHSAQTSATTLERTVLLETCGYRIVKAAGLAAAAAVLE